MPDKQMPRYQCHKKVWALKLEYVERALDGSNDGILTPLDPTFKSIRVSRDFVGKHDPQPYGYYVVYDDGYKSYSPADAFEDGYTLIEQGS